MAHHDREEWLESLEPGAEIAIACEHGRYPVTVRSVWDDAIDLDASGMRGGLLWVWRQNGMRPDWRCYILPADAPDDYPSPLGDIESMMEAA